MARLLAGTDSWCPSASELGASLKKRGSCIGPWNRSPIYRWSVTRALILRCRQIPRGPPQGLTASSACRNRRLSFLVSLGAPSILSPGPRATSYAKTPGGSLISRSWRHICMLIWPGSHFWGQCTMWGLYLSPLGGVARMGRRFSKWQCGEDFSPKRTPGFSYNLECPIFSFPQDSHNLGCLWSQSAPNLPHWMSTGGPL